MGPTADCLGGLKMTTYLREFSKQIHFLDIFKNNDAWALVFPICLMLVVGT